MSQTTPRFCKRCGSSLIAGSEDCDNCDSQAETGEPIRRGERSEGSILSAIALYFAMLGTTLVVLASGSESIANTFWVEILDSVIVLVWCLFSLPGVLPLLQRVGSRSWYAVAFFGSFITFAIASAAIAMFTGLFGLEAINYSELHFSEGYGWATLFLTICVQPAVIEELAFRGVMFSSLKRVLNDGEVIGITALMFMVLHLSVASFPHLFVMGLALGYLRVKSGSIYPCILLHFCHNGLVILFESLFG